MNVKHLKSSVFRCSFDILCFFGPNRVFSRFTLLWSVNLQGLHGLSVCLSVCLRVSDLMQVINLNISSTVKMFSSLHLSHMLTILLLTISYIQLLYTDEFTATDSKSAKNLHLRYMQVLLCINRIAQSV